MCKFTELFRSRTDAQLNKKKIPKAVYKDYCSFFLYINKYLDNDTDYETYRKMVRELTDTSISQYNLKGILYKQLQLTGITESEFFSYVYDKRNHPLARQNNIEALDEVRIIFKMLKELECKGE